jgi:dipeptidyl aminopeptidase/acylaminoacyl peptidase
MIVLPRTLAAVLVPFGLATFVAQAASQEPNGDSALTAETYLQPPAYIADAVMAPRHLNVTLGNPSPDGRLYIDGRGGGSPSIALLARPFHRLGGFQIDPRANRSRQLGIRSDVGLDVIDIETGSTTSIRVPDGARVSSPKWSPDGTQIGFLVHEDDATYVYVADPTSGRSRQVTHSPALATLYTSFEWMPDSRAIVAVLLPEDRGPAPVDPAVPTGPKVRITTPEENSIRTYPDLLENPHEKAMLEYYTTGQLAVVQVQNRRVRRIGEPAMIRSVTVSPDGGFARVGTMQKPFSYIVPTSRFGGVEELWNLETGAVLARLSERELNVGAPNDTTDNDDGDPEKRNIAWRPDGQGLSFLQQEPQQPADSAQADSTQADDARGARGRPDADQEGGDESSRSRRKDRVMQWLPPFDSTSLSVVYESNRRLSSVQYSDDARVLFLSEQQGQNVHQYAVFLDDTALTRYTLYRGERPRGRYGSGTRMLTKSLANGVSVVQISSDSAHVFFSGTDYADDPLDEGPSSYIKKVEIRTGDSTRVYESDNDGVWERVLHVLDDDVTRLVVSREGPTDVPDSYLRDLTSGDLRQVTANVDHTPDITSAPRRRLEVTRVDGFKLAVDVVLPEGWQGEPLPGMIWFYPREYTDQDSYDETRERYNKNQFRSIGTRSMEILVRHGYVVVKPDAPIVGESGRMNDNYVHDLRNNLSAVIDLLDDEGLIDRHRLGIGGHSYGAFSTFHAMIHTPFFKAGIAGDGNNNRTLTPFSFQSERRTLWEATDLYLEMSPFFQADHLTGALLMYHGEHDQNVGTFPIHSWRLFEAMEALGKTTSLYFYPYEDHGPAARETLLDLWARWVAWLDKYVKHAGQPDEEPVADDAGEEYQD